MKTATKRQLDNLARREVFEITAYLAEERKQERRFNGYSQYNLTHGDSFTFMNGSPTERMKFGFLSGCFPESKEPEDFQGWY